MSGTGILNGGEPAAIGVGGGGGDTVTLVEGATFCLSDSHGDIQPGRTHGLFFRDARLLSRWELRVDGRPLEPLSVQLPEAFAAQFISRRTPRPGLADSTLLAVRERIVDDGLRETVTLHNLAAESTVVAVELHVDADFADLFTVKEGRVPHGGADMTVVSGELVLHDRTEAVRGLTVRASGEPTVTPGAFTWRIVVPPRQRWQAEILVQPTGAAHSVNSRIRSGDRLQSSAPAQKIEAWRDVTTTVETDHSGLSSALRRSESDLAALLIHDDSGEGDPFVAAGAPWYMTLFGRDSLLTAWMALPLDPGLSVGTLRQLAEAQGQRLDPITEEQPGRILHEIRRGPASTDVLGGAVYYGAVDATPLFVMLLAECWRWGCDEDFVRSLLPAADAALGWAARYGDRDGDGFIEYRRATDRGLINQGWKDSFDGINDARGHVAEPPIALCEVQGYQYAALRARAQLAEAFDEPATASRLSDRAERLRTQFQESFWLPDAGCYAIALDGAKRPVDALTSNVGHCLWTGIAADEHVETIIDRLGDEDMDSGFGLRTLARSMGAYNPMSYHNGSVWPHDTAIAVAGLIRYRHVPGAVELAQRFATGLLDAATAFGGRLPELYCGFPRSEFSSPVPYPTSCSPQAWASAAPLLLVRAFLGLEPDAPARRITVSPCLPGSWGRTALTNLRLGGTTVHIEAEGQSAKVSGLPDGWEVLTPQD